MPTPLDITRDVEELLDLARRPPEERDIVILQRDGANIGLLLPAQDPETLAALIEQVEDLLDIEEARKVVEDPTEVWKPLDQVRAELGL